MYDVKMNKNGAINFELSIYMRKERKENSTFFQRQKKIAVQIQSKMLTGCRLYRCPRHCHFPNQRCQHSNFELIEILVCDH